MVTYESRPTLSLTSKSARKASRRKPVLGAALAAATLSALMLTPATAAYAGGNGAKATFKDCPLSNPKVTLCMVATTTGGEFAISSTTLSLSAPIVINMGLYPKHGELQAVAPTDGTPLMNAPPIPVSIEGISGLLTATPQLLGLPLVNLDNFLSGAGPALPLSMDVLLSGPASAGLGSDCTIGDAANPIMVDVTTGTTDPPPPNTPITGSLGQGNVNLKNGEFTQTGVTVVDNSFAVPGAYNCGIIPGSLDTILDTYEGLPSASGNNTAVMNLGDSLMPATNLR